MSFGLFTDVPHPGQDGQQTVRIPVTGGVMNNNDAFILSPQRAQIERGILKEITPQEMSESPSGSSFSPWCLTVPHFRPSSVHDCGHLSTPFSQRASSAGCCLSPHSLVRTARWSPQRRSCSSSSPSPSCRRTKKFSSFSSSSFSILRVAVDSFMVEINNTDVNMDVKRVEECSGGDYVWNDERASNLPTCGFAHIHDEGMTTSTSSSPSVLYCLRGKLQKQSFCTRWQAPRRRRVKNEIDSEERLVETSCIMMDWDVVLSDVDGRGYAYSDLEREEKSEGKEDSRDSHKVEAFFPLDSLRVLEQKTIEEKERWREWNKNLGCGQGGSFFSLGGEEDECCGGDSMKVSQQQQQHPDDGGNYYNSYSLQKYLLAWRKHKFQQLLRAIAYHSALPPSTPSDIVPHDNSLPVGLHRENPTPPSISSPRANIMSTATIPTSTNKARLIPIIHTEDDAIKGTSTRCCFNHPLPPPCTLLGEKKMENLFVSSSITTIGNKNNEANTDWEDGKKQEEEGEGEVEVEGGRREKPDKQWEHPLVDSTFSVELYAMENSSSDSKTKEENGGKPNGTAEEEEEEEKDTRRRRGTLVGRAEVRLDTLLAAVAEVPISPITRTSDDSTDGECSRVERKHPHHEDKRGQLVRLTLVRPSSSPNHWSPSPSPRPTRRASLRSPSSSFLSSSLSHSAEEEVPRINPTGGGEMEDACHGDTRSVQELHKKIEEEKTEEVEPCCNTGLAIGVLYCRVYASFSPIQTSMRVCEVEVTPNPLSFLSNSSLLGQTEREADERGASGVQRSDGSSIPISKSRSGSRWGSTTSASTGCLREHLHSVNKTIAQESTPLAVRPFSKHYSTTHGDITEEKVCPACGFPPSTIGLSLLPFSTASSVLLNHLPSHDYGPSRLSGVPPSTHTGHVPPFGHALLKEWKKRGSTDISKEKCEPWLSDHSLIHNFTPFAGEVPSGNEEDVRGSRLVIPPQMECCSEKKSASFFPFLPSLLHPIPQLPPPSLFPFSLTAERAIWVLSSSSSSSSCFSSSHPFLPVSYLGVPSKKGKDYYRSLLFRSRTPPLSVPRFQAAAAPPPPLPSSSFSFTFASPLSSNLEGKGGTDTSVTQKERKILDPVTKGDEEKDIRGEEGDAVSMSVMGPTTLSSSALPPHPTLSSTQQVRSAFQSAPNTIQKRTVQADMGDHMQNVEWVYFHTTPEHYEFVNTVLFPFLGADAPAPLTCTDSPTTANILTAFGSPGERPLSLPVANKIQRVESIGSLPLADQQCGACGPGKIGETGEPFLCITHANATGTKKNGPPQERVHQDQEGKAGDGGAARRNLEEVWRTGKWKAWNHSCVSPFKVGTPLWRGILSIPQGIELGGKERKESTMVKNSLPFLNAGSSCIASFASPSQSPPPRPSHTVMRTNSDHEMGSSVRSASPSFSVGSSEILGEFIVAWPPVAYRTFFSPCGCAGEEDEGNVLSRIEKGHGGREFLLSHSKGLHQNVASTFSKDRHDKLKEEDCNYLYLEAKFVSCLSLSTESEERINTSLPSSHALGSTPSLSRTTTPSPPRMGMLSMRTASTTTMKKMMISKKMKQSGTRSVSDVGSSCRRHGVNPHPLAMIHKSTSRAHTFEENKLLEDPTREGGRRDPSVSSLAAFQPSLLPSSSLPFFQVMTQLQFRFPVDPCHYFPTQHYPFHSGDPQDPKQNAPDDSVTHGRMNMNTPPPPYGSLHFSHNEKKNTEDRPSVLPVDCTRVEQSQFRAVDDYFHTALHQLEETRGRLLEEVAFFSFGEKRNTPDVERTGEVTGWEKEFCTEKNFTRDLPGVNKEGSTRGKKQSNEEKGKRGLGWFEQVVLQEIREAQRSLGKEIQEGVAISKEKKGSHVDSFIGADAGIEACRKKMEDHEKTLAMKEAELSLLQEETRKLKEQLIGAKKAINEFVAEELHQYARRLQQEEVGS